MFDANSTQKTMVKLNSSQLNRDAQIASETTEVPRHSTESLTSGDLRDGHSLRHTSHPQTDLSFNLRNIDFEAVNEYLEGENAQRMNRVGCRAVWRGAGAQHQFWDSSGGDAAPDDSDITRDSSHLGRYGLLTRRNLSVRRGVNFSTEPEP